MFGVAEALLLAGVIGAAFVLLRPLRRRLEARFTRLLGRPARRPGKVVVLERRSDGSFGKGDGHGG